MESVENMQDFNIPSIEHEVNNLDDDSSMSEGEHDMSPSEENKSEQAPAAQETDNEALSSLLMLSKQGAKQFTNDNAGDADNSKASSSAKPVAKRIPPAVDRNVRGDNQPLSKSVRIEDLRKYFHLPIVEVARHLGTCTTALKKICRKNKINKWPYRQIRSITKSIQSLEMASLNDTLNEDLRIQYRQQIVTLQNAIDELIKDPNNVVELVNMGLSEEALQNLRESNAASMAAATQKGSDGADSGHGSSSSSGPQPTSSHDAPAASQQTTTAPGGTSNKSGGYAMATSGNGGATGVLNLLQWPKPSADVQQIMQAAAQLSTQSSDNLGGARKVMKPTKRKASEVGDGTGAADDSTGNQEGPQSSGVDGTVDLSQLEGGNLRHKKVEIGDTIAECSFVAESQRMVFTGPVHLAALQRKKLRPNITRKVVPLMEPDIGSNFGIEFIPQFILSILHTAINGGSVGNNAGAGASSGNVGAGNAGNAGNAEHPSQHPSQHQSQQQNHQVHTQSHTQAHAHHQPEHVAHAAPGTSGVSSVSAQSAHVASSSAPNQAHDPSHVNHHNGVHTAYSHHSSHQGHGAHTENQGGGTSYRSGQDVNTGNNMDSAPYAHHT